MAIDFFNAEYIPQRGCEQWQLLRQGRMMAIEASMLGGNRGVPVAQGLRRATGRSRASGITMLH